MKMSKIKIAVLVLLVATVIYSVKLKQSVDAYEAWLDEYPLQYPPEIRPYLLMPNFWHTPFANHLALVGLALSVALLTTCYLAFRKAKFLAATGIFLFSSMVIFPVFAVDTVTYDVWIVKDEETGDLDTILKDLWRVENYYRNTFDIEFRWHYWQEWDSNDDTTDMVTLLEEAIYETGWHWSKRIDGESMELMVAFTGQSTNIPGFAFPWSCACIVRKTWLWDVEACILHEVGHQFNLAHCSREDCAMRPNEPVLIDPYYYCPSCEEKLYANRDCLLKPVPMMKTQADGWFYIPNISPAPDILKIEMLFNNKNITGDQVGVSYYPNGVVDRYDVRLFLGTYGLSEGEDRWDYMADVVPDGKIDREEEKVLLRNWCKRGTYITDLKGVRVIFNTGEMEFPRDPYRLAWIPEGATSFTVKRYDETKFEYVPIGAMIRFWKIY